MKLHIQVGGIATPLKNIYKHMKVSWDDSSQYMESQKIHGPNHQPDIKLILLRLLGED